MQESLVLEMLETGKTATWPANSGTQQGDEFVEKEVKGVPSTDRTKRMKERFMNAKCKMDMEAPIAYTKAWREYEGKPLYVRRGLSYKYMLEHLTPVIREDELITMSKTRYDRGATQVPQFATDFMISFLTQAEDQKEEAKLYSVEGGDEAHTVDEEGWTPVGQLFSIREEEVQPMLDVLDYWKTRCVENVSDDWMKTAFDGYEDYINAKKVGLFPGSGLHAGCDGRWIPAYDVALGGFNKVIEQCKENIAKTVVTTKEVADKVFFWQGCIYACEGAIAWANNYAKEARRLAETAEEPRKTELLEMAERLEHVPAEPARNFMEALQALWTAQILVMSDSLALGVSPGRWGKLLEPYYEKDLAEGKITKEQALEAMELIRIKCSTEEYITPSLWAAMASSNSFMNMAVGGLDPVTGQCTDNELEELILQAGINMPTPQPTLSILLSNKTSDSLALKAAECTKAGNGYPAWYNYEQMVEHNLWCYADENITLEDARNCALSGCVENGLAGTGHPIAHPAFYNEGKTIELALHEGVDPRTGIKVMEGIKPVKTYDDLWNNFVTLREHFMKVYMRYWNEVVACQRDIHPKIMGSILMHDCIENGRPVDNLGCRYNASVTLLDSGTVNVVNGLAAMKKLIWDDKKYTIDEFMDAMDHNFGFVLGAEKGNFSMLNQEIDPEKHMKYAQIHRDILNAPKFGNDDDYVDDIFVKVWQDYDRVTGSETTYNGYRWITAALSISAHGPHGRVTGATPDGRLAGVTLCDGILSASPGTDVNGPIALIRSGVKLDSTPFASVQLNMKFHPSAIRGDEGSKNFVEFIRSYFRMGGYHVQFNIVDSKMLRDAQDKPQNYRDLMVRVAGFSAYWNELGKPIQDEVIARTEYESL